MHNATNTNHAVDLIAKWYLEGKQYSWMVVELKKKGLRRKDGKFFTTADAAARVTRLRKQNPRKFKKRVGVQLKKKKKKKYTKPRVAKNVEEIDPTKPFGIVIDPKELPKYTWLHEPAELKELIDLVRLTVNSPVLASDRKVDLVKEMFL